MHVETAIDGCVFSITLNRPEKRNAITQQMYVDIRLALESAASNPDVAIATITGKGAYYSSGNDLGNLMNAGLTGDVDAMAKEAEAGLRVFVDAFIEFPKPLVALVNGPCVGIATTTLALCDLVYTSDNATFHTPFAALGQSPEACSSYLFPLIMGSARANEMLLLGRRITAKEAADRGLVTRVMPRASFQEETARVVRELAELPPQGLSVIKRLGPDVAKLRAVNARECAVLRERWASPECAQAILDFFARKAKL